MKSPIEPAAGQSSSRIDLIDALRGSALLGILLLHSVEHFDFLRYPPFPPEWLRAADQQVRDAAFFLFGGKAYAIFAMMFGLSFFLILDRSAARGMDFRWRFLWRLAVLAFIGFAHGILYCGDILTILAVLGVPLVVFHRLGNRALGWISALLLLQIPLLWQLGRFLLAPGYVPPPSHSGPYYGAIYPVFANGGFLELCRANLVQGQLGKWWWMIDNGRCTEMLGLFAWGLMLGRRRIFENQAAGVRLAKKALVTGALAFAALYWVQQHLGGWLPRGPGLRVARILADSYGDLAQMLVWAGGFVLLYHLTRAGTVLRLLIPYGRMSLTCYVTQAVFWVPVYYNFGLGLFRHLGQSYSILAGAVFFGGQLAAAHWWLKRFHYGPLEWLWRCATFLTFQIPFRKRSEAPPPDAGPVDIIRPESIRA